jgi:molybdopterin/thiamine biosynthesis adenylyltransferase
MERAIKEMGATGVGLLPENIYIVGAGGVTSYFMPPFIKTLAHQTDAKPRVYIVDGDILEERNLERQLFDKNGIQKNKAEAMKVQYLTEYKKIVATPRYFTIGSRVKEKSLIFGFVDNHVARRAILGACDTYNCVAIIGANEYTDAQAIYYTPAMSGSKLDPRIRYPEIMEDVSGDPTRAQGCDTKEALESAFQIPIANMACANYALQMFWFYIFIMPGMDEDSRKHWPIEHSNNFNKVMTRTEEFYGERAA